MRTRKNALNAEAWQAFLSENIGQDSQGNRTFAGQPISDGTVARAIHRWSVEKSDPDFWAADRFLCHFSIHIDQFLEEWCQEKDVSPWACEEPTWNRRPG